MVNRRVVVDHDQMTQLLACPPLKTIHGVVVCVGLLVYPRLA